MTRVKGMSHPVLSKEQFSYGHCIACPLIYASNEQRYIHHATPCIQRLRTCYVTKNKLSRDVVDVFDVHSSPAFYTSTFKI